MRPYPGGHRFAINRPDYGFEEVWAISYLLDAGRALPGCGWLTEHDSHDANNQHPSHDGPHPQELCHSGCGGMPDTV